MHPIIEELKKKKAQEACRTPNERAFLLLNQLIQLDMHESVFEKTHKGFLVKMHKSLLKQRLQEEQEDLQRQIDTTKMMTETLHEEYIAGKLDIFRKDAV